MYCSCVVGSEPKFVTAAASPVGSSRSIFPKSLTYTLYRPLHYRQQTVEPVITDLRILLRVLASIYCSLYSLNGCDKGESKFSEELHVNWITSNVALNLPLIIN